MKETVSSPISSDTSMSGLGILLPIHDSVLFVEGREFHGRLHKNKKVYAVVAERMMSAKKLAKEKREKKKSRSSEAV